MTALVQKVSLEKEKFFECLKSDLSSEFAKRVAKFEATIGDNRRIPSVFIDGFRLPFEDNELTAFLETEAIASSKSGEGQSLSDP